MVRIISLAAVALCLAGCGGESKKTPDAPASTPGAAASSPSAAPVSVVAKPLKERLIGSWRVDLDYIKSDAEMLALPAAEREKAMAMAKTLLKDLRLQFGADGTVKVGAKDRMNSGTFTAFSSAENTLQVQAKMKGPSGAVEDETLTVQFIADAILVTGADGKATRFRR
jgi:hypothetical protein